MKLASVEMSLPMGFHVIKEAPEFVAERDILLNKVFPDRVNRSSEAIRHESSQLLSLSFLILSPENKISATIQMWAITAGGKKAALLGPLVVDNNFQRKGLGKFLLIHSLKEAKKEGLGAIFLVGDVEYYKPFGFSNQFAEKFYFPEEFGYYDRNRLQAIELEKDFLKNVSGPILPSKNH